MAGGFMWSPRVVRRAWFAPLVPLRIEQLLYELNHWGEQNRVAGFEQCSRQRRHHVRFSGPGPTYQTDVRGTGEELAAQKLTDLSPQWGGVAVQIKRRNGFIAR